MKHTKYYKHGTFRIENKAKVALEKFKKSDPNKNFFIKKRQLRTATGGFKTRYTIVSVK